MAYESAAVLTFLGFQNHCDFSLVPQCAIPLLSGCQVRRAPYRARSPNSWRKRRTSFSACQAGNTKETKDGENRATWLASVSPYCVSGCGAALLGSDHTGDGKAEKNCRKLKKAVAHPPFPNLVKVFAQRDPFSPSHLCSLSQFL